MLKKIIKNIKNEGIIQKVEKWLIQNITPAQKKYIEQQYNGNKELISVKEFDVIQDSKVNGYIYVGVTAKGKNNQQYLCLLDEKTIRTTSYETDEIISDVNDGLNVQVLIKPLEKLENNGITPYLITSVIIDGIKG
jgi:hypothetical protein